MFCAYLSNHTDVSARGERLHESLGSRLGDRAKVVDQVRLGHANASVLKGEGVVGLVGDDADLHLGLGGEDVGVREGHVADLVEGVGRVGDELAEEDLLVGVKGVDDEGEELVDVSGEREGLGGRGGIGGVRLWEGG